LEPGRSLGLALLAASLCAGGALRAWLSFNDDGIYWPDEIYQSLEPAHRLVFGYGLIAWEYLRGARSWALPGLVAGLLKLCVWFGATEPRQYLYVVRLFFSALGVATAYAAYRLAREHGASTIAAACSAALFALVAPAIYFGPRAMSETASALPVALGLALALRPQPSRWATALGVSLLGAAVLFRLQNAVFAIAVLGILAARRNWRQLLEAAVVFAIWAVLFGLLDKLTWGGWFHSAVVYLRANVLEHKSEVWGTSPVTYYLEVPWRSMAGPMACIAVLGLFAAARAPGLLVAAAAFVLLHSLIPHKELRFILPALPIFCALAGVGIGALQMRSRLAGLPAVAAILICSALSALRFHRLTFGDLGQYEDLKPGASAYDDFGSVNRLLLAAHGRPDLCGLKIEAVHLAWTGGFTYLHRRVPLYSHLGPARQSGFYNYVIAFIGPMRPDQVAAAEGNLVLQRLSQSKCVKDDAYQWLLP
jgi:phosphatidylinositol glycan class B